MDAPPATEPITLWLTGLGVTHVFARELNDKAEKLFTHQGLEVISGMPALDPDSLVDNYLSLAASACSPGK